MQTDGRTDRQMDRWQHRLREGQRQRPDTVRQRSDNCTQTEKEPHVAITKRSAVTHTTTHTHTVARVRAWHTRQSDAVGAHVERSYSDCKLLLLLLLLARSPSVWTTSNSNSNSNVDIWDVRSLVSQQRTAGAIAIASYTQ